MPVKHSFTSGVADGADATLVRPSNWNADHNAPPFVVPLHVSERTWTNMPAAATELWGTTSARTKVDLTYVTQARIVCQVRISGVAGAVLTVEYSTDGTTWTEISAGTASIDLGAITTVATAWFNIPAGAKADVFLRVMGSSGDGVADPSIGNLALQVR